MDRLIDVYDIIDEGGESPLDGKLGGIIITGDTNVSNILPVT
jgi:hypothetical protein